MTDHSLPHRLHAMDKLAIKRTVISSRDSAATTANCNSSCCCIESARINAVELFRNAAAPFVGHRVKNYLPMHSVQRYMKDMRIAMTKDSRLRRRRDTSAAS